MNSLRVYYDGDCPVCRTEVRFYERRDKVKAIVWMDINGLDDVQLPTGKSRAALLGKFHVLDDNGGWHVGVDAFAAIWKSLPLFRRLAWVFKAPGLRQLAQLGYRCFLIWQRRNRRSRQLHATA